MWIPTFLIEPAWATLPKALPIAEIHGPDGNRYLTLTDLNYAYYMVAVICVYAVFHMGKFIYEMLLRKGQSLDDRVKHLEEQNAGMLEILHRIDERTEFYDKTAVRKDEVHEMVQEGVEYALRLRETR